MSSKRNNPESPSSNKKLRLNSSNDLPTGDSPLDVVVVSSDEESSKVNKFCLEYSEVRIGGFRDRMGGVVNIGNDSLEFNINCYGGIIRISLSTMDVNECSCSEKNSAIFIKVTKNFIEKVEGVITLSNNNSPVILTDRANDHILVFIWSQKLSSLQHKQIHAFLLSTDKLEVSELPSVQASVLLGRRKFYEFISQNLVGLVDYPTHSSIPKPSCEKFIYPNSTLPGSITVLKSDIACLEEDEFLNDVIINFYLKYLIKEKVPPTTRSRIHIFNTFFFESLSQFPRSKNWEEMLNRHSRVKSWTKDVDIFSKNMLFVPININFHWLFAIIWHPFMVTNPPAPDDHHFSKFPCIIVVDSLVVAKYPFIIRNLKEYLQVELNVRRGYDPPIVIDRTNLKGFHPNVPQQVNSSDCGLHMLDYIERIIFSPFVYSNAPSPDLFELLKKESPCMSKKREEIASICYKLLI